MPVEICVCCHKVVALYETGGRINVGDKIILTDSCPDCRKREMERLKRLSQKNKEVHLNEE
ncbi:MAG: hypothetical protein V1809_06955 [Planctomycetota bacterium]